MPYPPEQIQKLYEKLPSELKTALFSEETAEVISNTCEQYGIEDERVSQVAKHVGDVLTGFILPSEFEDTLRQNVGLPEVLVKAITREINRFVFFPHKAALEQLHAKFGEQESEIEIPTPRHSDDYLTKRGQTQEQEKPVFTEEQQQTEKDTYRETIE